MRESAKKLSDKLSGTDYIAAQTVSMAVASPSNDGDSSKISVFGDASLSSLNESSTQGGSNGSNKTIFSVSLQM